MKIACLQFSPEVGQLRTNIAKANALIDDAVAAQRTANLDWLLLPELALTGYNFPSLEAIGPFLEPTAAGASTKWAIEVAQRLRCHVTVGYPEAASDGRRFNSAVTVSPAGEVLANYRKTFLYYTDETWAHEGDERFFSGPLGALGHVSMVSLAGNTVTSQCSNTPRRIIENPYSNLHPKGRSIETEPYHRAYAWISIRTSSSHPGMHTSSRAPVWLRNRPSSPSPWPG